MKWFRKITGIRKNVIAVVIKWINITLKKNVFSI